MSIRIFKIMLCNTLFCHCRYLLPVLLSLLILLGCHPLSYFCPSSDAWAQDQFIPEIGRHKILIINSYHPGYAWSDDEQAGIMTMLQSEDNNWTPYIEYLDSKRFPTEENRRLFINNLNYKYRQDKFSVVITIDDPALEFALNNQKGLLKNAPIVFCGVNNFTPYMLSGHPDVTGVEENLDTLGTLEIMLKLHPKTREILVVSDNTITGLSAKYEIDELIPFLSDKVKFRFIGNLSLVEVLNELEKLPKDTLVLERSFIRDKTGRSFALTETTELFAKHSPVPIYGAQEQRLGYGIVGGKLLSGREHGAHAARIAMRVLAGEKASNIPVVTQSDARYMFDYKVLDRFGIPLSALPQNSIIINKPVSFYAANKNVIISSVAIIAFLSLIILFLTVSIMQRRRAEHAISKSEIRYQELADSITDIFYALDRNLKYTYWNKASENLTGITAKEAFGKSLFDLFPDTRGTKVEEIYRTAIRTQRPQYFVDVYRHNGKDYFMEISVYPSKEGISIFTKDITQRKHAEEEMQHRSNLLYSTIDSSIDYIFVKDLQLRMILCNKAFAKALDKIPTELHGKTDVENGWDPDLVYGNPDKGFRGFENDDIKALSGKTVRIASEPRIVSGNMHYFNTIKLPLRDVKGNIIGMLGISRDITDRKQAEDALKMSEERYREIFDRTASCIVVYEARRNGNDFIIREFNKAAEKAEKISRSEVIGHNVVDIFPGIIEFGLFNVLQRVWQTSNPEYFPVSFYTDKRIEGWRENYIYKLPSGELVTVYEDVTEKKIMENTLASEKERLLVTLRSIGDGVITTDTNGAITLMNKVAEKLTGWSFDEALGRQLMDVFQIRNEQSGTTCENPVDKVMQTGKIVALANHTVLIDRNGRERIVADSGAPILDRESNIIGVVLVFRDITEKKKSEEALQNSERLESIGVLAGGIAHDFNNLLGGLFGYVEMARDYSEQGDLKHVTVNLAKALTAFDRAKNLTQQLLTFAKGGTPILKTHSIAQFVQDTVKFVLSGSKISPAFFIPDNIWLCDFDENQMAQVIDNIVINARQSMPQGKRLEVSLANIQHAGNPEANSEQPYVRISIHDFGTGISKDHLSRIFDPFFTTKHHGSGLGLSTCYSIVKKHNGFIEVESEVGSGTTFHVYLPAASGQILPQEAIINVHHDGEGRILIMDDEESILDIATELLRKMGYSAVCATNGDQAIELAEQAKQEGQPFKIAILDLTIPGGRGGKETVEELIRIDPQIKVIASSGYSADPVMATPTEYGFAGTLIKPYRHRDLVRVFQKML